MRTALLIGLIIASINTLAETVIPSSARSTRVENEVKNTLIEELNSKGLAYGSPVFIRIFKEESQLEFWVQHKDSVFHLFKSYAICDFSGNLGPKIRQGDMQSPEGFYFVTPNQLNPWSTYHLSFNLGYPNAYDRYHGRTGNYLMVHGNCVSIGCYAMTDKYINEIYTLSAAALRNGQDFFRVHVFPFRLTESKLSKNKDNRNISFWRNLKPGFDYFEEHRRPPNIEVVRGKYHVTSPSLQTSAR